MTTLSPLLDVAKTPGEWARVLTEKGIPLSERTLREKAYLLGAYHKIGRTMIITPQQIDQIFQGEAGCRSKPTKGPIRGGCGGGSNISARQSASTTDAALAHLTKVARGDGANLRKSG